MSTIAPCSRILVVAAVVVAAFSASKAECQSAKIRVSYETTRLLEPVDEDGYVDYVAALNHKYGAGVEPQRNAAVLLDAVHGELLKYLPMEWWYRRWELMDRPPLPPEGDYFVDYWQWHEQSGADPEVVEAQFSGAFDQPWNEQACPLVEQWLDHFEQHFDRATDAARRPQYFAPILAIDDGPLFKAANPVDVLAVGRIGRGLTQRVKRRAASGRISEAWQDVFAIFSMAAHLGGRPDFTGQDRSHFIHACALQAVGNLVASPDTKVAQLRTFRQFLAALPQRCRTAELIDEYERYSILSAVQCLAEGESVPFPNFPDSDVQDVDWNEVMRQANIAIDEILAVVRIKDRQLRAVEQTRLEADFDGDSTVDLRAVSRQARARSIARTLTRNSLSYINALKVEERDAVRMDLIRAALVLREHQLVTGRFPAALSEINSGDAASPFADRFNNDRPFVYRQADKGFMIYSVGENGMDDGAEPTSIFHNRDDLVLRVGYPTE